MLPWTLGYMYLFWVMVFSGYMPSGGLAGLYGSFMEGAVFFSSFLGFLSPEDSYCSLLLFPLLGSLITIHNYVGVCRIFLLSAYGNRRFTCHLRAHLNSYLFSQLSPSLDPFFSLPLSFPLLFLSLSFSVPHPHPVGPGEQGDHLRYLEFNICGNQHVFSYCPIPPKFQYCIMLLVWWKWAQMCSQLHLWLRPQHSVSQAEETLFLHWFKMCFLNVKENKLWFHMLFSMISCKYMVFQVHRVSTLLVSVGLET